VTYAKKFAELRDKKTGDTVAQFFGPGASDDPLSICLRVLTHQLQQRVSDSEQGGGFFGGSFGYGVNFDNSVFEMHPDWQGGCTCGATEPQHAPACEERRWEYVRARNDYAVVPSTPEERDADVQSALAMGMSQLGAAMTTAFRPWSWERAEEYERNHPHPGCPPDCTAIGWVERESHDPTCRLEQHCFTFKPSGFVLDWYKYIGRDNDVVDGGRNTPTIGEMFGACLASIGAPALDDALREYAKAEDEEAESLKRGMAAMYAEIDDS